MNKHKSRESTPDALKGEIDRTRADMSATVGEIEERLSPAHLKEQVNEVKEQVLSGLDEVKDHIKAEVQRELHEAKDALKAQYSEAKDHFKEEIRGVGHDVRDATIGKVGHMVDSAQTTVKEAGWSVLGTIKENPIPAALVGVGVAWLLFNRSSTKKSGNIEVREVAGRARQPGLLNASAGNGAPGSQRQHRTVEAIVADGVGAAVHGATDIAHRAGHAIEGAAGSAGEAVSHAGDAVKTAAQQVGGSVGNAAHQVGSTVGDAGKRAGAAVKHVALDMKETTSHLAHDAVALTQGVVHDATDATGRLGHRAYDATTGFVRDTARGAGGIVKTSVDAASRAERSVEKAYIAQPLPFAALAFAFGAAAGLAIPHSTREDELMGEAKDQLLRKVEDVARNVIERAEGGAAQLLHPDAQRKQAQADGAASQG